MSTKTRVVAMQRLRVACNAAEASCIELYLETQGIPSLTCLSWASACSVRILVDFVHLRTVYLFLSERSEPLRCVVCVGRPQLEGCAGVAVSVCTGNKGTYSVTASDRNDQQFMR